MKLPIYLDYAATTPVDSRVADKMMQHLTMEGVFANPASIYSAGVAAKDAVDMARAQVAAVIQAEASEIIFTSGATEANNLALKGAAQLYQRKGKHIVTVKTEHPAVLECCQQLEKEGFFVTYLTPESNGLLDLKKFESALREDTILVSVMHVNNEIGVIQEIEKIAAITSQRDILFHTDAAQSVGKIALNVQTTPVDLVSLCAHKAYGPKGVGALYVRRKPRIRVAAQIHGGGQEQGMRSGTLAVHQIVGMGEAFQLAKEEMNTECEKIRALKQRFWRGLSVLSGVAINGSEEHSVPHILNIYFPKMRAEKLMQVMPELAISAGSACNAKGIEPSYVLRALGMTAEQAHCALRFSFGRFTTVEQIDFAIEHICSTVRAVEKQR